MDLLAEMIMRGKSNADLLGEGSPLIRSGQPSHRQRRVDTADKPVEAPPGLIDSLGVTPRYVGKSIFDYLAEFETEEAVRNLRPDFGLMKKIGARGVIATSRSSDADFDFVSRYFAPAFGIDEDPVTGSTHCALAPYWSRRLGKNTFRARQISERGGVLKVELKGDRVALGGQAVTVLRAELLA